MTFWQYSNSFPPILCRLLARHRGGKPLTTQGIVILANNYLSEHQIEALSKATNWNGVTVSDMFDFLRGTNMMFDNAPSMRRTLDYLRKNPNFEYLRKSPDWESYYKPLLIRWASTPKPATLHKYVLRLNERLASLATHKIP